MNASPHTVSAPRRGPKTGPETRERLLRVAEELFARDGIDAVSLRRIMDAAKVGASQLNYHFGTKKDLLRAIMSRKLDLLSAQRLGALDEALAHDPVSVEAILEAYFLPSFRTFADASSGNFVRLIARIGADSSELAQEIAAEFLDPVQRRFAEALARALPGHDARDIYWRIHVMLCIVIQSHMNPMRIQKLSGGLCDPSDPQAMFSALIPMLSAALRAPGAAVPGVAAPARARRRRA